MSERGMSLIEVMVTVLVVSVGLLTTVGAITRFGEKSYEAQQRSTMVSLAQREMERVRALPYAQVGLNRSVDQSAPSSARLPTYYSTEALVSGGVVDPGGNPVQVQGTAMTVYRYVTWRRQGCPLLRARVASELSDGWGQTQSEVEAALGDLCPGVQHTKRVTVVVVGDHLASPGDRSVPQSVRLSSVIVDPDSTIGANGSFQGLNVDVGPVVDAVSGPQQPANDPHASVSPQQWHLYDTPCSQPARQVPTGDHPSHDTGAVSAGCGTGGSTHDLMGTAAVPGLPADPLFDVSTDVHRTMRGGLALRQDSRAGGCAERVSYPDGHVSDRGAIHTWATPASTQPFSTAASSGRATVTFWTQSADGTPRPARLCLVLRRSDTGAVLGATEYALPTWPAEPAQLAVAFDVVAATMPAGARLLLTARNPGNGESDVILLYDHPAYQSAVSVTMQSGGELR